MQLQSRVAEIEAWLSSAVAPDRYAGVDVVAAFERKHADMFAELRALKGEPLVRKSEFGCVYEWVVGEGWVRVS